MKEEVVVGRWKRWRSSHPALRPITSPPISTVSTAIPHQTYPLPAGSFSREYVHESRMGSERLAVMAEFSRKADGRQVFPVAFKPETVGRITSGEKTLAALSREPGISPSVFRNGMRLGERGGTSAVAAGRDAVPASGHGRWRSLSKSCSACVKSDLPTRGRTNARALRQVHSWAGSVLLGIGGSFSRASRGLYLNGHFRPARSRLSSPDVHQRTGPSPF
jgi:transposase-like protein